MYYTSSAGGTDGDYYDPDPTMQYTSVHGSTEWTGHGDAGFNTSKGQESWGSLSDDTLMSAHQRLGSWQSVRFNSSAAPSIRGSVGDHAVRLIGPSRSASSGVPVTGNTGLLPKPRLSAGVQTFQPRAVAGSASRSTGPPRQPGLLPPPSHISQASSSTVEYDYESQKAGYYPLDSIDESWHGQSREAAVAFGVGKSFQSRVMIREGSSGMQCDNTDDMAGASFYGRSTGTSDRMHEDDRHSAMNLHGYNGSVGMAYGGVSRTLLPAPPPPGPASHRALTATQGSTGGLGSPLAYNKLAPLSATTGRPAGPIGPTTVYRGQTLGHSGLQGTGSRLPAPQSVSSYCRGSQGVSGSSDVDNRLHSARIPTAASLRSSSKPLVQPQAPVTGPTQRPPQPLMSIQTKLQKFSSMSCDELGIDTHPEPATPVKDEKTEAVENRDSDDDSSDEEPDMTQCKVCDIKFEKEQAYHVHIRSTSHFQNTVEAKRRRKEAKMLLTDEDLSKAAASQSFVSTCSAQKDVDKGQNYCEFCSFGFSNSEVFNSHLKGLVHRQKLEEFQKNAASVQDKKAKQQNVDSESQNKKVATTDASQKIIRAEDFNPDEDFKFSVAPFTCTVCNVMCTGEKSYEMHVAGTKHQKKLRKQQEIANFEKKMEEKGDEPVITVTKSKKGRVVRIQDELDKCSEPLIGLDYITEYQMEDPNSDPCYICDLCQSKMDAAQVISHVIGIRHRQKYFKFHGQKEYWTLWDIRRKSDKVKLANRFAAEHQRRDGRHKLRIKVLMSPFTGDSSNDGGKPVWKEVQDSATRPVQELPGFQTMEELTAKYKSLKEGEDDEMDEEDEPPARHGRGRPPRDNNEPSMHPRDPYDQPFDRPPYFADRPPVPFRHPYGSIPTPYPPYNRPSYDRHPYDRPPYDQGPYDAVGFTNRFANRPVFDYTAGYLTRPDSDVPSRPSYLDRDPHSAAKDHDVRLLTRPTLSLTVVDYNHGTVTSRDSGQQPADDRGNWVGKSTDRLPLDDRDFRAADRQESLSRDVSYYDKRESLSRDVSYDRQESLSRDVSYYDKRESLSRDVSYDRQEPLSRDVNYYDKRESLSRNVGYDRQESLSRDVIPADSQNASRPCVVNYDTLSHDLASLRSILSRDQQASVASSDYEKRCIIKYDHDVTPVLGGDVKPPAVTPTVTLESERQAGRQDAEYIIVQASNSQQLIKPPTAEVDINFIQNTIAACNMNTESDAELALKISNALTQALLEHRQNMLHQQGKSDPALERHLIDLRTQNAELAECSLHVAGGKMQAALAAAVRLASILATDHSQDTIQQAMSVLDAVNKKLYGMIDATAAEPPQTAESHKPHTATTTTTTTTGEVRRPISPIETRGPVSVPSKRFRFGL